MKKNVLAIALTAALALGILSGCNSNSAGSGTSAGSSGSQSSGDSAPETTYTMRIAHILDTGSIRHQSLEMFKEEVEEKTNGGIKVELYPSAQLGSDDELVEQVKNGTIEGYRGSAIDTVIPEYNIYSMPFLFADVDEAAAVMASDWGKALADKSEVNNVKILATGTGGMRVLTNNVRPVMTPEDMKGLKLRTPSWEVTILTMEALGANCTSISYNETYMALKTNVADGQENPWVYIVEPKFYEVQKYASDINWSLTLEYFPINLTWYNSLPAEYQQIITEAAEECMLYNNEQNKELEQTYIDTCAEYMDIYYLTDEQRQMFVEAATPVYDHYIETGLFTQADLDEIRDIITEYKAG